jgi:hypothetical protein
MVWTTQAQLQSARLALAMADGTLFRKASDAGIASNENEPQFAGVLSNAAFLARLVEAGQLGAGEAAALQTTVSAGSQLDSDLDRHARLWNNLQTALFFSSLPETYAHSDIAARLAATGQITQGDRAAIRIDDTGRRTTAIVAGMADGGGTGLHRAFLLGARHDRLSRVDPRGLINQVSLAFTLLTFSFTPFAAMGRGGLDVPTADRQLAWLQLWNVIGSLMGVGPEGLPATRAEAAALDALIRGSAEFRRTAAGEQLITVLVEIGGGSTGPFFLFGGEPLLVLLGVQRPPQ